MVLFGNLQDIEQFKRMPEIYEQLVALQKIKAEDCTAEIKKVVVEEGKNYFMYGEMPTKHLDPPKLEVHHRAADIHCEFEGVEAIYFGDTSGTEADGEYIAERDVAFLKGKKENVVFLHPGEFLVIMPEVIHSPLNFAYGSENVKKAVGKIFYK